MLNVPIKISMTLVPTSLISAINLSGCRVRFCNLVEMQKTYARKLVGAQVSQQSSNHRQLSLQLQSVFFILTLLLGCAHKSTQRYYVLLNLEHLSQATFRKMPRSGHTQPTPYA